MALNGRDALGLLLRRPISATLGNVDFAVCNRQRRTTRPESSYFCWRCSFVHRRLVIVKAGYVQVRASI